MSGARAKTFERIKNYRVHLGSQLDLFTAEELKQLEQIVDEIYRYPLLPSALEILNRQLRLQITDRGLVALLLNLKKDGRLCQKIEPEAQEVQLVCSLGLNAGNATSSFALAQTRGDDLQLDLKR